MGPPPQVISHPSPSFGPRRDGARPDMVVLHYTAMQSAAAALTRLCDENAEVSAHYLICEAGRIWQMVDEDMRAWHAGAGRWGDVGDINSRSIGIELANRGDHPFPEPQMAALTALLDGVMGRWQVPPERVIGHSDMAPGRKRDPGPRFDWARLARAGLSVWPAAGAQGEGAPGEGAPGEGAPGEGVPGEGAPGDFPTDAARFGYPVGDVEAALILDAFRLRFRPWAEGPLDDIDRGLMADLAARWPVAKAGC